MKVTTTTTYTYEGTQAEIAAAQKAAAKDANGKDSSGSGKSGCDAGDPTTTATTAGYTACANAYSTCNMISPQNALLLQQAMSSVKSTVASSSMATNAVAADNSAATSCEIGAGMSAIAGSATLALAIMCETKVSACKRANPAPAAGTAATAETKTLATNRAVCGSLDANWAMDGIQALTYAASAAQNLSCASFYKQAAADAATKTCAQEPTRPDCICVINPNDPSCLGQTAGLTASTGFSDSSLRGNGNSASGADDTLPGAVDPGGSQNQASMPGAPGGGGAGGPSLLGGKSAPDAPDGNGAGPYNTNVISGTTSGAGANPYAHGSSGEGGDNSSLLNALANKFNLKKYLPGQARGLASTGRDGMTGANGPSIWEKVSTQYNRKKGEMTP